MCVNIIVQALEMYRCNLMKSFSQQIKRWWLKVNSVGCLNLHLFNSQIPERKILKGNQRLYGGQPTPADILVMQFISAAIKVIV